MLDSNSALEGSGGAVFNHKGADIKLAGCKLTGNTSKKAGGALFNSGKITLLKTAFDANHARDGNGGAVNNQRTGVVHGVDVEFTGNVAGKEGGAIFSVLDKNVVVKKCRFDGNEPDDGV